MASRKKANPYASTLASVARTIAKSKPNKLHAPLFEAFVVFAAAGDRTRASTVLDWMYGGRAPQPTAVASALSTCAMDGFCHAAGLGDRTGGLPRHERTVAGQGPLPERVAEGERAVRGRLTLDAYDEDEPVDDGWKDKAPDDPWRRIGRWRRIQELVRKGQEEAALDRLSDLLDELAPDDRGAGYGDELVLALDLALRHGRDDRIPAWLARHGRRFAVEAFLLQSALGLPAIAARVAQGLLRETIGLTDDDLDAGLRAISAALDASSAADVKPAGKVPKVQKRRVSCEYDQVHLEPETLDAVEKENVHFQRSGDVERGASVFPTMVGIATPSETDYVDVEIAVMGEEAPDLDGVVQAVSFPLTVRAPLVLSSVGSAGTGEDEPFAVPPGAYDVLARFVPKKAPKASAEAGLRVFKLLLSFHPSGALGAPRTLVMDGG